MPVESTVESNLNKQQHSVLSHPKSVTLPKELGDPGAILRMNNLESLQVQPRSDAPRKFGAVTIGGEGRIGALKLKLLALG